MNEIAQIKRFLERWTSDPAFQAAVAEDPDGAVAAAGIDVDPHQIRAIWEVSPEADRDEAVTEPVLAYRAWYQDQLRWRDEVIKASSPDELRFKTWRFRQVARCRVQMYLGNENSVVHAPVCFELSKGCSVGCWFCGVGAEKLSEHFTHTDANRRLWREVLQVMHRIAGDSAAQGFCYWASEPLDNPDYEKFCLDYAEVLGRFPQTTTAIAMKDPARTRSVLELSRQHGCDVNRFSLMSIKALTRVHAEFSAEELLNVELIAQNRESTLVKANAGAFRELAKRKPKMLQHEKDKMRRMIQQRIPEIDQMALNTLSAPAGSIACVSGFLFNMVERSVKLITPCNASDDWPLGYVVLEEGRFSDAADLEDLLEGMVSRHMTTTLAADRQLGFYPDLRHSRLDDGFAVTGDYRTVDFSSPNSAAYMQFIGRMISEGGHTVGQIATMGLYQHGVPEADTVKLLNRINAMGILDEAAVPAGAGALSRGTAPIELQA